MKKFRIFCLLFGLALMLCAFGVANATVVTFDDLPDSDGWISNGYAGFNWNNFYYFNADTFSGNPSGFQNGIVSPHNVAFNAFGDPAALSDSVFTFNSAYFTAAWNDGLSIDITGKNSGNQLYFATITVNTSGPTLFSSNWTGIDELDFYSYGGVSHGYGGGGNHFAMDNFTYNAVPEPATMLLLGLGLVGLAGVRRKIQK